MQFCEIVNFESKLLNFAVPTDPLTLSGAILVDKSPQDGTLEPRRLELGTLEIQKNWIPCKSGVKIRFCSLSTNFD